MVSSPKQTNVSATRKQIRISLWYIFHVSSPLERNAKPLPTNSMQFETAADNRGIRKGKVVGWKATKRKIWIFNFPQVHDRGRNYCIFSIASSVNVPSIWLDVWFLLILFCFTNDPEIWREISNWIPQYRYFSKATKE